ncbi:MAG: AAA family ATPase, partial [Deltaproteobacteria bacterium]|nr:AAA family ATPase [Deltaproteobacteria bacterium]
MYTEFYGFSEKPFNVTPNPKFLFFTDSHREALSSMVYGITERKGFIAITGEVGTGKTTLVHHLLQTLDKKTKTVFIYQTHISFAGLLKNILLELEIELEGNDVASFIRQLNDYLVQRLVADENLAILIDEAQNLSKEVLEDLRMLSNLETPNFKLIQIVFLGQPEFDGKLNSPDMRQLKQRIGIRRQLRALTDRATRQYIDHRLRIAGSSSSQIFSSGALALIARYAEGIPRNINMICDNSFLIGYSLSRKKIDEKIIREVLNDLGMDNAGRNPQTMEQCKNFGNPEAFEPLESSPGQATKDAGPETPDSGQPILAFGPSILESRQRVVISAVRPQPLQPKPSRKKNRAWAAIVILAGLGLGVFFENDYIHNVGHKWVVNSVAGQALAPAPASFVKVSIKANPEGVKPPAEAKIDVPQATVPPAPEEKTKPSQSLGPRPVPKA